VTHKEARLALDIVRRYLQNSCDDLTVLRCYDKLDDAIAKKQTAGMRQKKLTEYFGR
jgi:hypothetical protein